jgi:hypothetical protein
LDCLKDDTKFILDISEQLHASLGLYIFLVSLERKSGVSIVSEQQHLVKVRSNYFEPLHHTSEAGLESLAQQEKSMSGHLAEPIHAKRNALFLLQD